MDEEKKKGSGKKWFFGCCGGLFLLAIVCAGGSWFGAGYLKDQAATKMREGLAEVIEKSELSSEQTNGINAQAERLEAAIKGWGLVETLEHMENLEPVVEDIQTISFHAILLSYAGYVLPKTPLPEEERKAGLRILQRYARGFDEGTLQLNKNDDSWHFKAGRGSGEKVEFDIEEVREHLASLKKKVDAAGIPDEAYEVDLANKLKTIVDAFIGEE